MRKQNIIYKALLAFTMILLLCFTACSDLLNKDLKKKSTVFISLENAGERSVLPVYDFESFKDFKLIGKKGGVTTILEQWDDYDALEESNSIQLDPGNWTFDLTAKKGNEEFKGSVSATVEEETQISLSFELEHVASTAKGSVNIVLRYTLSNNIKSIAYTFNVLGGSSSLTIVSGDDVKTGNVTISRDNLTAGKYLLECNFYADDYTSNQNAELTGTFNEIIVVESGLETALDLKIPYLNTRNISVAATKSENLDFIFDVNKLGTTTITMKRSEWNKLCDDYRYFYKNENCVHAENYKFEKDGQYWSIPNVGFRLRGNTSRFCPQGLDNGRLQGQMNADWSEEYYQYAEQPNNDYRQSHFKVDFEEFLEDDEEMKMAGCLKGVALKRLDNAGGREIFCYDLFRRYGIWTAPRASYTRVILEFIEDEGDNSITTVDYGVYEMFEEVNKQSLKAREKDSKNSSIPANAWANNKGNLWKCQTDLTTANSTSDKMGVEDIRIFYEGETITGTSIKAEEDGKGRIGRVWDAYPMDLKTNKDKLDAAKTELLGFINELNALPTPSSEEDSASINTIKAFYEKWFDVDFFLKTYAINILCGMDDDYWGNGNNFYLYFDTGKNGTGKVYFIPFDYDNTLGASIKEGGFKHNPLTWGRGQNRPLIDRLISVPEYKAKFKEYLLTLSAENSEWNATACMNRFSSWANMINPYLNSPDLDVHNSRKSLWDGTWQPEGYFIYTNPNNNIFDATREWFDRNINSRVLTITAASCNQGIKINIVNIPDRGARRNIFINGKQAASIDAEIDSGAGTWQWRDGFVQDEFVYPFTTAGNTYSIYVEYSDINYRTVEVSNTLMIKATSGLGELYIANSPQIEFNNNILVIYPCPQVKYGDTELISNGAWNKFFTIELQAIENNNSSYLSWNYMDDPRREGLEYMIPNGMDPYIALDFISDKNAAKVNEPNYKPDYVVAPDRRNSDIIYQMKYSIGYEEGVCDTDSYGGYVLPIYDYDTAHPLRMSSN